MKRLFVYSYRREEGVEGRGSTSPKERPSSREKKGEERREDFRLMVRGEKGRRRQSGKGPLPIKGERDHQQKKGKEIYLPLKRKAHLGGRAITLKI